MEWNWHLDVICRELELVMKGETRDLLICEPPGFAKSLIVSVLWPSHWWLREPAKRFVALSGGEDLAVRDNRRMREVVESEWYQRLVARVDEIHGTKAWGFAADQNQKRYFENSARGHRQCFGVNGSVTGQRGDGLIIDDPHQVRDVLGDIDNVEATLDKAWNKCNAILATRVYDRRVSWTVTIMQRVHLLDVAGRKLARAKGRKRSGTPLRTVILAMRYDPACEDNHPEDPRTELGELLDPVRMPQEEVEALAAELDEFPGQASAQLDQRPVPPSGGLFKGDWMQRYDFDPQRPDTRFQLVAITVDGTFKKTKTGSFVSIQAWGLRGFTGRYLLAEVHARMDYVDTKQAIRDLAARFRPRVILVELKALGEAIVRELKDEFQGVIGFLPDTYGDKMARAQLAAPVWAAMNVWLPQPQWMPTVGEYIAEVKSFPFGADDRVDAMSQLFLWLADNQAILGPAQALSKGLRALADEYEG